MRRIYKTFPAKGESYKFDSFLAHYSKTINLLIREFGLDRNLRSAGQPYLSFLHRVWKHRGGATTIKIAKQSRLYVTRHLSGNPLTDKTPGIKLTKDYLPVVLGPELLRIVRRGTLSEKRALLTILYSTRSITLPVQPDYESIEAPNRSEKLERITAEISSHSYEFWRSLGLRKRVTEETFPRFNRFHLTTKSGPNGHALWSFWKDYLALPSCLKTLLCEFGGDDFSSRLNSYEEPFMFAWLNANFGYSQTSSKASKGDKKEGLFRLITSIPDKEGKTRVIAIGDYFSQTVLYPFHKYLFKCLRRIKQDCTFDQSRFKEFLQETEGPYYSIDLTAFTDRFPIVAIEAVLKGHFPDKSINNWSKIMVGYPFWDKTLQRFVNYSVGNPMGFYSSWNSTTLAHHFVVFLACKRLKRNWKESSYVLLGDDIVINDKEIAREYMDILHCLGVEASPTKTHVSNDTYEFAKRWVHKGEEISPFPIGGWKEVVKRYNLMVNFLQSLESKGWIPSKGIVSVVSSWYEYDSKPKRFRNTIIERTAICEIVTNVMKGTINGVQGINLLVQHKESKDFEYILEEEQGNYLFQRACMEAFTETNDPKLDDPKVKPLGLLAQTLIMNLTSYEEYFPLMEKGIYPYYIPILNVYGSIEEAYLAIQREAWEIDTFRNGDWPLLLRALTIPTSDEVFHVRNFDILPMASANIAKRIYSNIEEFRSLKRMGY
jgi:hypothetical protein